MSERPTSSCLEDFDFSVEFYAYDYSAYFWGYSLLVVLLEAGDGCGIFFSFFFFEALFNASVILDFAAFIF